MSASKIEPLDGRLMFSIVDFSDLVSLAQNYGSGTSDISQEAWDRGDYNSDGKLDFQDTETFWQKYKFRSDFQYADTITFNEKGEEVRIPPAYTPNPRAELNAKGKLTITMATANDAVVTMTRSGRTSVTLTKATSNLQNTAAAFSGSFRNVKSIELRGSTSADRISVGEGVRTPTVHAGGGDDTVVDQGGATLIFAGLGNDTIYAGRGDDSIYGEIGDDRIYGETGNDILDGGSGKDRLDGGKGKNKLGGGSGTDHLVIRAGKDKTDRDAKDKLTELA